MKKLLLALATAGALLAPAAAHAEVFLAADATGDPGYVRLTAVGTTDLRDLRFGELRDGSFTELGRGAEFTPFYTDPRYGEMGAYTDDRATTWECDRRTRTFAIYATAPDGTEESASFTVRTPSCSHRFTYDGPLEVRPGRFVKLFVRDTFELGSTSVNVCRTPPGAATICRRLSFGQGQAVARQFFTVPTKGRWKLSIRSPDQTIKRVINVGVKPLPGDLANQPSLITTGDSLMQGPDALLQDRLDDEAVVNSDVYVGSGLTRPFIVDWAKLPGKQIKKFDPDAVMLFLGANDSSSIGSADCCGDAWIRAYAGLARKTINQYVASGAQVFWLNIPIPEDPQRQTNAIAVNQALDLAVRGIPEAHVVDINAVFTPGNVYRETIEYEGKQVSVRQSDGLHLSVAGSSITDKILIAQLKKFGVL